METVLSFSAIVNKALGNAFTSRRAVFHTIMTLVYWEKEISINMSDISYQKTSWALEHSISIKFYQSEGV
jgi:hypothetical protein